MLIAPVAPVTLVAKVFPKSLPVMPLEPPAQVTLIILLGK